MNTTPEALERAMKELDQNQQALMAQVQRMQSLHKEVTELEELAQRDPKARERLTRLQEGLRTDLVPIKLKLDKHIENMHRQYAIGASLLTSIQTGQDSAKPARRKARTKLSRTFI